MCFWWEKNAKSSTDIIKFHDKFYMDSTWLNISSLFTYNVLKETKILDNQDLLENAHTSLELNM